MTSSGMGRRRHRRAGASVAAVLGLLAAFGGAFGAAHAETFPARLDHVAAPGRSIAADDTAEAIVLNPANVATSPGPEFRWSGVHCGNTEQVGCGHALSAVLPLPFDFATGARFDFVSPAGSAPGTFSGQTYQWFSWALAYRFSDALSVGTTFDWSFSSAPQLRVTGISTGVSLRPNPFLGMSLVARDWNAPGAAQYTTAGTPLLDRSYVAALAFRPTGRRNLEFGAEVKYLQGNDLVLPRLTAGIDVPYVGRLRGDLEAVHLIDGSRRGFLGSIGLEVAYGPATAGGGFLFGDGLGSPSSLGGYAYASITGYRNPGIPKPARFLTFRIERTPGTRRHVNLVRTLLKLSEDREVAGIGLVLRTEPASSLPHAEELADAIRVLRARGKKVLCNLEDAGARSLYVCANADRTVMNPAGGLRYAGMRAQYYYLAGLLDKIGVKAQFVRIGEHKTAPEQYTNTGASPTAKEDHLDLLNQMSAVFDRNVAQGRKLSLDRVREVTAKGPFVASEAREFGLIDGYAFDDETDRVAKELVGKSVTIAKYEPETKAPTAFGNRDKVAILYVDGDIVDGRSQVVPLLDMRMVGSYTICDSIKKLRDDNSVKSVVLRIESPGGSSMASDVMWRELTLLAKKKPLVVSMGSIAASGGYYIAAAAKTVYALPLTITGSIGVFYGKADVSGLLGKLGVTIETYRTTPRADAESFFRPFTDDEIVELRRKVGQFYDTFLDRVARGRPLTKEQIDAVGQGHVWTGQQAFDRKLVDRLGGIRQALETAREQGGLPGDAPVVEYPPVELSLFDRALSLLGFDGLPIPGLKAVVPPQFRDMARALAPMAVYKGDEAMTRMEWVPLEDTTTSEEED